MSSRARASARLFVAVDPPPEVCHELAGWARTVAAGSAPGTDRGRRGTSSPARAELRVLDEAGLHITLCFLGSRPVEEIETLALTLAGCSGRAAELSVGAPLWLPPRRPRALAVEIHDPSGELARLQHELSGALARAVDWQPGHRRFRAHLTVARIRTPQGGTGGREGFSGEMPGPATPPLKFTARSFTLYRSFLDPEGASYEPLASQSLEADAPESA
jgi:2'-5' RNA ligase